jgi:transcriptional regulator with XRE-family HTH domain
MSLRAERRNRGLTLREAAEAIGVDKSALARAERNEGSPTARHAFAIASFYGYKVTDLWPVEDSVSGKAA